MSPIPSHEAIDQMHAAMIAQLLAKSTPEAIRVHYSKLIDAHNYSQLEVRYIDSGIGKGVFATKKFETDELFLKEHMLVGAQHTQNKADALVCSFCFRFIGSIELQIGRRLLSTVHEDKDETKEDHIDTVHGSRKNLCCRDSKTAKDNEKDIGCSRDLFSGVAEALINDSLHLPFTDLFTLPAITSCMGGCEDEFFCSELCAKAAWDSYHSLLCTGPNSLCKNKDYLSKFIDHANETNDIFLVAAKVLSSTILKASKLKQPERHGTQELLEAWEPFSMGFKRLWWNSVALPPDLEPDDEGEFRKQIKELASHSLMLLKGAMFHAEYAALFSLQVYGQIIGMFELNNLDLVVASPVEDYFIYIDELPLAQKTEAEKSTGPLLDALGDDYNTPCQGTAFFPIQSCLNHSCLPNLKAFKRDEDTDGQAVLIATRPIQPGEELTISYIDEDLSWEERKAMLEDYGFLCECKKCIARS